jgi:rsbT co-antagonist protein RsbR
VTDLVNQGSTQLLAREMGLTEQAVERRRRIVALEPADLARIAAIREVVLAHADQLVSSFFDYLGALDEGRALTKNGAVAARARELKRLHLIAMVGGDYGRAYLEQRLELATLYSRIGLDLRVFIAAFYHLLKSIGEIVMKNSPQAPLEAFENVAALQKVACLDIGVITDAIVFERERVITQQQDAIRELSTPVLQIRERLLLLPIIGVIDTQRARLVTESLLQAIRANRAKVVVMDVTGVATIDSKVANHLMQTVAAAKLMGAAVIVTGLSAEVAQSLVGLGIDLASLNTIGDLQGGMEEAERMLGYRVLMEDVRRSATKPLPV